MIKLPKISIHTTRFQQGLILFTVIYLSTLLFLQYKQSYFSEETVKLTKITKKEMRLASQVEAGLHIFNFPRFNFYKNSFIMDGTVFFKFPVGSESLHTIDKFSFQNGAILSKSEPLVQIIGKDVMIRYHVVVKFSTNLNYKNFPVSDHKLKIVLQNKTVSPYELYFTSDTDSFGLSKNLLSGNWRPDTIYVDYGYLKSATYREYTAFQAIFPSVAFTIDFKNADFRHFIILYLPLFLLFLIIFTSLLTNVDSISIRFPIVASVVPILALHSLVIESVSPTGSHMTKIDQIYLTIIGLSLVILLFQAYVGLTVKGFVGEKEKIVIQHKERLKKINDFVIIFVLAVLVISVSYSTFT